ncbi:MAG TPA: NAD(P)-dependent oxidoreductase [Bryobacteraceae bacterium]|nr:NAD(P)-dependent oxidoreductase [Bryobacteraceae bacterium]
MSTNDVNARTPEVGVIGLGIMGGTFARHLAGAGLRTLGYDPIAAQMEAFQAGGGEGCASSRAVAAEADVVITSLPSVKALEEALCGKEGVVAAGRRGLLVVETSTLPLDAKEWARARLAEAGIAMLDAPISGTGPQAVAKDITILASGDRADYERALGVISHLARSVRYVGEFGAGSKVKYIANLLVAVHVLATAEAIVLGEKAGLDPAALVEILADSAATSRMLEVRGPSMAAGTYATPMMKVDVFQKDLEIIGAFARQVQSPVPLFSASVPFFTAAAAQGMGGYDTGAVIAVLRKMAEQAR